MNYVTSFTYGKRHANIAIYSVATARQTNNYV